MTSQLPAADALLDRLRQVRVVPVVVIDDAADAVPLAEALAEGGLPCVEITFRTAAGAEALRRIAGERPDLLVGAGTVLTPRQAADARSAGAQFVVSPGFDPAVVDYCLEHEVPVFPGVCTPTEVTMALGRGLRVLKFFPAESAGGVPFLQALVSPFAMVRFIPTGGVRLDNLASYLALPNVVACGGSWMAPPEWTAARQFDRIRNAAATALRAARTAAAPPLAASTAGVP